MLEIYRIANLFLTVTDNNSLMKYNMKNETKKQAEKLDSSNEKLLLSDVINLVCRMCNSEVYKNDDGQFICCKCGHVQ
jgi:hypothetical protein